MRALQALTQELTQFDQLILRWIADRRTPAIDALMRGFTRAGDWQSWTLLGLSAIIAGGEARTTALAVLPRLLGTFGFCYAVKRASRRPRPSQSMRSFSSLLKNPDPYSFPSSHTACAWVICISLGLVLGWGWAAWIGLASAISYSRIHVGAHYPLDVMIGTIIGVAAALL